MITANTTISCDETGKWDIGRPDDGPFRSPTTMNCLDTASSLISRVAWCNTISTFAVTRLARHSPSGAIVRLWRSGRAPTGPKALMCRPTTSSPGLPTTHPSTRRISDLRSVCCLHRRENEKNYSFLHVQTILESPLGPYTTVTT